MAFKHGHYIDSGRSSEEREKACISTEEEKESIRHKLIEIDKREIGDTPFCH